MKNQGAFMIKWKHQCCQLSLANHVMFFCRYCCVIGHDELETSVWCFHKILSHPDLEDGSGIGGQMSTIVFCKHNGALMLPHGRKVTVSPQTTCTLVRLVSPSRNLSINTLKTWKTEFSGPNPTDTRLLTATKKFHVKECWENSFRHPGRLILR